MLKALPAVTAGLVPTLAFLVFFLGCHECAPLLLNTEEAVVCDRRTVTLWQYPLSALSVHGPQMVPEDVCVCVCVCLCVCTVCVDRISLKWHIFT